MMKKIIVICSFILIVSNNVCALDQYTVRLSIAYTQSALQQAANGSVDSMNDFLDLAVLETNQSFINSKINNLRVRLVDSFLTTYTESGSFTTDLNRLKANSDGYIDNIHTSLGSNDADIGVLIIDDNSYCGFATGIGVNRNNSFIVVYWDCATGNYSLAHEIGHLHGARHDTYVDSNNKPFSYGHGFVDVKNRWRTIMAYNDECSNINVFCNRVQYWSNPNVKYLKNPTGTIKTENNARVLFETAKTVADFTNPLDDTLVFRNTQIEGPYTASAREIIFRPKTVILKNIDDNKVVFISEE